MTIQSPIKSLFILALLVTTLLSGAVTAQATPAAGAKNMAATPDNAVLLTVFLKHDQSRPLTALRTQLAEQAFHKVFPPDGVEVVSWNITMGIGHVIVLRLPARRLAEVNLAIENTAWGVYTTEFFPTYDYTPIAQAAQAKARQPGTAQ